MKHIRTLDFFDTTVGIMETGYTSEESGVELTVTAYYSQPFVVKNDSVYCLFDGGKCATISVEKYQGHLSHKPIVKLGTYRETAHDMKVVKTEFATFSEAVDKVEDYLNVK